MNKNGLLKFLLPVRCIMFLAIFILGAYITGRRVESITNWWSIVATVTNILTILIIFMCVKNVSGYAKLIGYERGKTKVKQIIIISLVVLFVSILGMYIAGYICYGKLPYFSAEMVKPIPLALAIINFVLLPLTVPFAEDGLYLGCGVNQMKNKYLSIIVPAFCYALQHCFIPTLFDMKFIIYRLISFLPLTIILCIYYYKKKNPIPIMVGHAVVEIASVVMILITSASPEIYQMMLSM